MGTIFIYCSTGLEICQPPKAELLVIKKTDPPRRTKNYFTLALPVFNMRKPAYLFDGRNILNRFQKKSLVL